MTTETTNSRPTHRVFAVIKNGKKKFWQPIGALWAHADGRELQPLTRLPAAQRLRRNPGQTSITNIRLTSDRKYSSRFLLSPFWSVL